MHHYVFTNVGIIVVYRGRFEKINIHRILLSLYRKIQTLKKIYERFAEEKTLLDFLSTSAVFQLSLILKIF